MTFERTIVFVEREDERSFGLILFVPEALSVLKRPDRFGTTFSDVWAPDALGLRFLMSQCLWRSRSTPVQRIASKINRRRFGPTFSDVVAPLALSRYACAANRLRDMVRLPWPEI